MEKKITVQELAAADRTSEGPYVRQLGAEEKATLAESIADLSQQEEDKAQAKKDATAMFNAELKELKLHRKGLMKQKRTGYADAHGKLFTFYALDERTRYTYNEHGELVQSSRMTADEITEAGQYDLTKVPGVIPMNTKAAN